MKKWIAFLLLFVLLTGSVAGEGNSTYSALVFVDDPFVSKLMAYQGMTASQIQQFMDAVDEYITGFGENIYEADADTMFITILLQVMQREEHLPVLVAFDAMFPEEISHMLQTRTLPPVMKRFMDVAMRGKVIIEVFPQEPEDSVSPQPTPTPPPEKDSVYYNDMKTFPYAIDAVDAMTELGILNGTGEGSFSPEANITREEFSKLVISALLETNDLYTTEYFLNPTGSWYEPYVAATEFYDLSFGYYEWPYALEQPITREEMVTVAYRAARRAGITLPDIGYATDFDDMHQIQYYAVEPIQELQKANIISGVGDNKFEPTGATKRADAVLIIYRLMMLA